MKRESALVGFGLIGIAVLMASVALARCTGTEPRPAQSASETEPPNAGDAATGEPVAEAETHAPPGKSPGAAAEVDSEATGKPVSSVGAPQDTATGALASATSSAASRIARALAASHPADLKLLGSIERELRREPPPEVHAMLRRRAEGAQRDELVRMAQALPDLQLRVLALRWVDEVRPAADAAARAPAVPAPGSATPFVKPIQRAP